MPNQRQPRRGRVLAVARGGQGADRRPLPLPPHVRREAPRLKPRVQLAVDKFGRPVTVPIDSLPTVHSVIIGPSGMGKSWTVGTWLLKLAEAGVRVVVVDPHGDYLRWAGIVGAQVLKVPEEVPEDLAEVLRQSQWFRRLLAELGSTDGATSLTGLSREPPRRASRRGQCRCLAGTWSLT
ncbi:hypothetical protein CGL51_04395 [Pyrobaculum aerophilum]|uniref:Helicase HerA central domain-containing protein n=1 Tax=Pyrobaculum aerophilum TaxID=13773 RepID=A0A371R0K1_9CREN|nr:hypothetical protein CGL51_04395 [Pyrobaculum aerophilum]